MGIKDACNNAVKVEGKTVHLHEENLKSMPYALQEELRLMAPLRRPLNPEVHFPPIF